MASDGRTAAAMKSIPGLVLISAFLLGACATGHCEQRRLVTQENWYHRRPGTPGGHFHQTKTLRSVPVIKGETATGGSKRRK